MGSELAKQPKKAHFYVSTNRSRFSQQHQRMSKGGMVNEAQTPENSELEIATGCTICTEAILLGKVRIGAGTIIHPKASIIAESGPIIIGENNLIEENAQIINRRDSSISDKVLHIGSNNAFEVGCKVTAVKIGDNNIVEAKAYVGPNVELTNGCVIGAMCELTTDEVLPENTVIFGRECQRRINHERLMISPQVSQLDYLRKVLPNYHYLKKPTEGVAK